MSFSYTVGGKSLTHTKKDDQGQNREKETRRSKQAKNSSLSSGSDNRLRGGKRHTAGEQPGSDRSASPAARKATRTKPTGNPPKVSNIVTLSDLQNPQSKLRTDGRLKEVNKRTDNPTIDIKSVSSGRKLGRARGAFNNSSSTVNKASSSRSSVNKGDRRPTLSTHSTPVKSEDSKKNYNSQISHKPIDKREKANRLANHSIRTSPNLQTSVRGRGTQGLKESMAYNSRYSSSSLYSSNPKPVGQRPVREDGSTQDRQQQETAAGQASQGSPHQKDESCGSYRVIQPNPSKREKLMSKSQQELKAYEDFKASKKPVTIHGAPKSTGGSKSEEEARLDLEKKNRNKKYEQILKKEQQRKERREQEDQKFNEKKARARKVAEENERKRKDRAAKLSQDHAKTNEDFLRRLESGMSPQSSGQTVSQSPELRQLIEMFPKKAASKLQELLDITGNDVEKVIDLLMD